MVSATSMTLSVPCRYTLDLPALESLLTKLQTTAVVTQLVQVCDLALIAWVILTLVCLRVGFGWQSSASVCRRALAA